MNVLAWNIRGLNDPLKQQEVLVLLLNNKVDVAAVIETHVKEDAINLVWKNKLAGFSLVTNNKYHSNGRIWVFWVPAKVSVVVYGMSAQHIHCQVLHRISKQTFEITFVYAFNLGSQRRALWDSLQSIALGVSLPWICLGDYNVTLSAEERQGSAQVNYGDMEEFKDCLELFGLTDLPSTGLTYTWYNG
ncbi:uncharacterized protein LOC141627604 [Silene latifolia]|uniref:uncharacterized protein LOC141627604 n=1 Tax=Silene latifolia TaxID=37657 RepID=UPI003D774D20